MTMLTEFSGPQAALSLADHQNGTKPRPRVDVAALEKIGYDLLVAIGEDPSRPGLKETPKRFAKWWREFIEYDPGRADTTFALEETGQMVIVSGLKVWSLCEHHLLPFWCDISIAYIPTTQVLGLSKFARIAQFFAHRLQIQEQLVRQVARMVERVTASPDVAVLAKGEHLCMTMRGIRTPGVMASSLLKGQFQTRPELRAEFLSIIKFAQS